MRADRHRGKHYGPGLLELFSPTNSAGVRHHSFGQGSNRLVLFSVLDLIDLVAAGPDRFKVLANRLAMAHRDRLGFQGGFAKALEFLGLLAIRADRFLFLGIRFLGLNIRLALSGLLALELHLLFGREG